MFLYKCTCFGIKKGCLHQVSCCLFNVWQAFVALAGFYTKRGWTCGIVAVLVFERLGRLPEACCCSSLTLGIAAIPPGLTAGMLATLFLICSDVKPEKLGKCRECAVQMQVHGSRRGQAMSRSKGHQY
jgi:hypothetical protein